MLWSLCVHLTGPQNALKFVHILHIILWVSAGLFDNEFDISISGMDNRDGSPQSETGLI